MPNIHLATGDSGTSSRARSATAKRTLYCSATSAVCLLLWIASQRNQSDPSLKVVHQTLSVPNVTLENSVHDHWRDVEGSWHAAFNRKSQKRPLPNAIASTTPKESTIAYTDEPALFTRKQPHLPPEFNQLFPMSAYLDKRGLWAAGKPARHPTYTIVIVSVAPKLYSGKEGLSCAVKGAADDPLLVDARLTAHPGDAVHRHPYTTVTIECDVKPASLSGNLSVSLTTSSETEGLTDTSYMPVRVLSSLDYARHATGEGKSAVCISPVRGDRYAPSLYFFVDYYTRVLGFEQIYIYLSDPGPAFLASLRQILEEDTTGAIKPILFAHDSNWLNTESRKNVTVSWSDWRLPRLSLPPENIAEPDYAGPDHWRIHYGAQLTAITDFHYRALANNIRWALQIDLDEFVLPVLPNRAAWHGRFTEPSLLRALTKQSAEMDQLPSSKTWAIAPYYEFRSAFVHSTLSPGSLPAGTKLPHGVTEVDILQPNLLLPPALAWTVRDRDFFPAGVRSKYLFDPSAIRYVGIHHWNTGHPAFPPAQLVFVPPPEVRKASSIMSAGIWHARVDSHTADELNAQGLQWMRSNSLPDLGRSLLASFRHLIPQHPLKELVVDTTFLEVMGEAILDRQAVAEGRTESIPAGRIVQGRRAKSLLRQR